MNNNKINAASIGQLLIGGVLCIQLLLCIAILASNSSGPSLFMTLLRLLSILIAAIFLLATITRIQSFEPEKWVTVVWGLFVAAVVCTVISLCCMEYYSLNPTQECFVSPSAAGCLARMDVLCISSYIALLWHFHISRKV